MTRKETQAQAVKLNPMNPNDAVKIAQILREAFPYGEIEFDNAVVIVRTKNVFCRRSDLNAIQARANAIQARTGCREIEAVIKAYTNTLAYELKF